MKHFSKLVFAAGLLLSAASANATVEFQLTIDHPEYLKVSVDWNEIEVQAGTTTMALDDYANFSIETRDYQKHLLREVLVDGVNQLNGSGFYRSQYNINELQGTTVEVVSCLIDDLRTGHFTITADNPKRLSYVSTNGSPNTSVKINEMVAGEPYTVNYIPDVNTTIQFNANGAPIYKILKNGVEQAQNEYNYFVIDIEDGMELEVFADYPDVMANLNFNFHNDAEAVFNRLYIYGDASNGYAKTEVEVIDHHAQVPLGSQIVIEHKVDYANYNFNSYTVGSKTFYNVYQTVQTYILDENVEIDIDAELSTPVNVVFNVTGADGIIANRKEANDTLTFTEGEQNVVLYASNLELTIKSYPSYNIQSLTLNGQPKEKSWDDTYRFYAYENEISDGARIEIVATPKETYKAYINVDDASLIVLKRNYQKWSEEVVPLHDGRNEVVCTEGNNSFYITASENGYVNSVNLNYDEEVNQDYYGGYNFTVEADYEVMVSAEPIVNEGDIVIYVDDRENVHVSSFYWGINGGRTNDNEIVSGYNVRGFFHGFNPYKASVYYTYGDPVTYSFYLNDERQECPYPSYPSNEVNLAPGDVVKIFLADEEPGFYDVTFSSSVEGVSFGEISYDVIRTVEDHEATLNVLKGTGFDFNIVAAQDDQESGLYAVTVNSLAIEPDENGIYHVAVTEDSEIKIMPAIEVSVEETLTDSQEEMFFTVDGIRLGGRPTAPGIYVSVKGNKVTKTVIR